MSFLLATKALVSQFRPNNLKSADQQQAIEFEYVAYPCPVRENQLLKQPFSNYVRSESPGVDIKLSSQLNSLELVI